MTIDLPEFLKLRAELPVIDVRSPKEFKEGHIFGAINIPILNDEERKAVGIDYKEKGQAEAIRTGFRLVGPRLESIVTEAQEVADGKEILVHCWRGGMRSNNFCQFVSMAGVKTHALKGGYKSYRQHAIKYLEQPFPFAVIGGCTGSGKTELLKALAAAGEQIIDLEEMANHRGSVFGALMKPPQPTTEQFQNDLFEAMSQLDFSKRIWVEDESLSIGKIFIPDTYFQTMSQAPVVVIEADRDARIQRLVDEYGPADKKEFIQAMTAIRKKLGGQHFKDALQSYKDGNLPGAFSELLVYYDKRYLKGIDKLQDRVIAKFDWDGKDITNLTHQILSANFKQDTKSTLVN